MLRRKQSSGFSLVELLLVLAIIGIISAIAIPSYLGQRRRARVIGDAITNAEVIRMQMETRRADAGLYGPTAGGTFTWINGVASDPTFLPGFTPSGNSRMNFSLEVGGNGLTYVLTVTDPSIGDVIAYQTNQNGEELARLQ